PCAPCRLFGARICRGRRTDELWDKPSRHVSAGRRLCRTHPQGREASRHAGGTADEVRAGHQPPDRPHARPRNPGGRARDRRRGDRMMRRREFITLLGAAAAWPLAARAQQPAKLPTIGYLGSGTRATQGEWAAAFVQRLRELGWIDARTVAIEYRWAQGRDERAAEIAAEFVRRKV